MTLFHIGYTRVKLHPGLIIVFLGAVILGNLSELSQAFFALTMHEVFHAVATYALGYNIESVEFLPFGGVAQLGNQPMHNKAYFIIAMAGPVCNFVVAAGIALFMKWQPALAGPLQYFLSMNITLAMFNMLPALPLDGGRMLYAILSRITRPRTATVIAALMGIICALCLLTLSGYIFIWNHAFNPFLTVMGIFLLLGAIKEMKQLPSAQISAMLRKRDALSRFEAVPAQTIALNRNTPGFIALKKLSASRFTLLYVLDDNCNVIGRLDEGKLLSGIAKMGQQVKIGELLNPIR